MPRQAIGTTNVGLYNPLSLLIGGLGGTYPMSYIRDLTWPTQGFPGQARVGLYAQAANQWLFQIQIRSNDGSFGSVSIVSPWSQTSTGTSYIGGGRQAYSFVHSNITITADRIYPRVFNRWQVDQTGATWSTTQTIGIFPTDSIVINNQTLTAIFV